MAIRWQTLASGVFLIDADGFRPVLFAPLQGVAMEVNSAYVEAFRLALQGQPEAALSLGLKSGVLEAFTQTPATLATRIEPKWSSAFAPTSVTVFLTHKCTMRCAYCYCHGGDGGDMPWPVFERAVRFTVENARQKGRGMTFGIHGGDVGACWPLFQKCVAFVRQVCEEADVKPLMTIGTNGLYSEEQAEYIATHLQSATLSIDGTPAVHDRCRTAYGGQPTSARVLQTARIFDRKQFSYSARMTVTQEAVPLLPESVDFICRHTQVKTLRAEPLYSRGRAASLHLEAPDPDDFVAAFRKAHNVARSHGRNLSYSAARLFGVYGSFCSYPEPTFGVTPEGNLTCCYEIIHPTDPLREPFFYGNIPPDGSDIVVDPERVEAIRTWARNRRAACADCFCVHACAGDCAAKIMDAALPEGEVPKRCRITRALVYDAIRAVLTGIPPLQSAPLAGSAASSGSVCACVDCAKPAAPGKPGAGDPPGEGRPS